MPGHKSPVKYKLFLIIIHRPERLEIPRRTEFLQRICQKAGR